MTRQPKKPLPPIPPSYLADLKFAARRKVGNYLRHMRVEGDMTQLELASVLGVGETAISAIENGRNSVSGDLAPQLAEIFGLDPSEFGKFLLRAEDPRLYAMIFGIDAKDLQVELDAYANAPRPSQRKGPRRPH